MPGTKRRVSLAPEKHTMLTLNSEPGRPQPWSFVALPFGCPSTADVRLTYPLESQTGLLHACYAGVYSRLIQIVLAWHLLLSFSIVTGRRVAPAAMNGVGRLGPPAPAGG